MQCSTFSRGDTKSNRGPRPKSRWFFGKVDPARHPPFGPGLFMPMAADIREKRSVGDPTRLRCGNVLGPTLHFWEISPDSICLQAFHLIWCLLEWSHICSPYERVVYARLEINSSPLKSLNFVLNSLPSLILSPSSKIRLVLWRVVWSLRDGPALVSLEQLRIHHLLRWECGRGVWPVFASEYLCLASPVAHTLCHVSTSAFYPKYKFPENSPLLEFFLS